MIVWLKNKSTYTFFSDFSFDKWINSLFFWTDTFASKVAAIQDSTADNSVGNVTGSNAVNVFLGIGIAWSLAAFYHKWHRRSFEVNAGK